jgi:hypothetical protein
MIVTSLPNIRALASAALLTALTIATGSSLAAQEFGASVVGQVLDAETDVAVEGATVSVTEVAGSHLTDALGQFRLEGLRPGAHEIRVQHIAYGVQVDTLVVTAGERIVLEFRVATRPIEVAGISVTARSSTVDADLARGTRFDGMNAAEVDGVRTRVSTMGDLVRQARIPGLTVRQQSDSICIESNRFRRRFANDASSCNTVQVVVDDVLMADPVYSLVSMDPQRVESFELVPPIEAGVLYGGMGRFGVLRVYTLDGRGPALGYEDYSAIGPRWAVSLAFNAQGGSTLYSGTVRVRHPEGLIATPYTEQSTTSPGLEASVRWNTGKFGFLGGSFYATTGTSTGTFDRVGGSNESFSRDYQSYGTDIWFAFPLLNSAPWNAQFGVGPSFVWQTLRLSQGNSSRISNVTQSATPQVDWSDRSWWAPGGNLSADLTYDIGHQSGIFLGIVFRALSAAAGPWSAQEEEDILRSTGNLVQVSYSSGIATSLTFRTGVRWYPGAGPLN